MNGTGGKPGDRLYPGAYLAGYRLEERIGRGGPGRGVPRHGRATRPPGGDEDPGAGLTNDHAFRTRFINESHAAAAVEHPHILPVYDAGEASGLLFIAMRYVPGGDVRSLVRGQGPLSARRGWSIIAQIAAALDAAHQLRLVHRDVKPANMLLDSSSRMAGAHRSDHAYLTDFGISKQAQAAGGLTVVGQIMGTLEYAAPEQIDGEPVDGRTDVYALACSTFELLTGEPPFRQRLGPALIYAQLSQAPPSLVQRRPELSPVGRSRAGQGHGQDPGRPVPDLRQLRRRPRPGAAADRRPGRGDRPGTDIRTPRPRSRRSRRPPGQETRVVHRRPLPPTGPTRQPGGPIARCQSTSRRRSGVTRRIRTASKRPAKMRG